jgi:hypothetical protein
MAAWSIIHTLGDAEQRRAAAFLRTRWYDNAAAATEAAREADAVAHAAATAVLTPDDHSIFQSCVYNSPCWILRALVRSAAAGDALPP